MILEILQSRFKSRLFDLHAFFAFSSKFLKNPRRQFRVRKIFRTKLLRDLQPFHFVFEIAFLKLRNFCSRLPCH